jgi:DNA-binding CsgD family transcriptional regulator/CheY-like chemotaxis protein
VIQGTFSGENQSYITGDILNRFYTIGLAVKVTGTMVHINQVRVLHIDDEPDHHAWTRAQLLKHNENLTILHVSTRSEAEELLASTRIQCVMADNAREGFAQELMRELRAAGRVMPFILQTDQPLENDHEPGILFDDDLNVAVSFCRYDLLVLWIQRFADEIGLGGAPNHFGGRMLTTADLQLLTEREEEILFLVAGGKANKEIAAQLGISYRTAVNHVHNMFSKLGIHSRAEAIHLVLASPELRSRARS